MSLYCLSSHLHVLKPLTKNFEVNVDKIAKKKRLTIVLGDRSVLST